MPSVRDKRDCAACRGLARGKVHEVLKADRREAICLRHTRSLKRPPKPNISRAELVS
jgi:hypothetical protein